MSRPRRDKASKRAGKDKTCGTKVDWCSEAKAWEKAIEMSHQNGYDMAAYSCPFCKGWHIGGAFSKNPDEKYKRR